MLKWIDERGSNFLGQFSDEWWHNMLLVLSGKKCMRCFHWLGFRKVSFQVWVPSWSCYSGRNPHWSEKLKKPWAYALGRILWGLTKDLYCCCPFLSIVRDMQHILGRKIREEHKSHRDCIDTGTWQFELRNHSICYCVQFKHFWCPTERDLTVLTYYPCL